MPATPQPAPASAGSTLEEGLRTLRRRWNALADFLGRHGRFLTVANVFGQGAIMVTGGAVRLTGSGLGCVTFPECEPGSVLPVAHPALGFHPYVEFGNRMVAIALLILTAALAVGVWRSRRSLRWLGLVPLAGVFAQALLGGITVIVKLNPFFVATHMLLSTALVWLSVQLALRYRQAPRRIGRCVKRPMRALTGLLAIVVILGTVTTGSGPHSGDAEQTARFNLDPALVARAHSMAVWAFVVVLAYVVWRVRKDRSEGDRDEVRRAWIVLAVITLLQGVIGYLQYFTGLPVVLVGAHLAGAGALVAAQSAAFYLLRRRSRTAPASPHVSVP